MQEHNKRYTNQRSIKKDNRNMNNKGRGFSTQKGPGYGDSYDTRETRKPSTQIEGES
jgi:hypothetical protein